MVIRIRKRPMGLSRLLFVGYCKGDIVLGSP